MMVYQCWMLMPIEMCALNIRAEWTKYVYPGIYLAEEEREYEEEEEKNHHKITWTVGGSSRII